MGVVEPGRADDFAVVGGEFGVGVVDLVMYDCPVHGATDTVIYVTLVGKHERVYCVACWDEHLAAHLPILFEREIDADNTDTAA